ncbi:hypothetical protein QOZ80_8AG0619500 [Eleusine coracana subsp. coracana]|nr:hypothetical protein QOZ80_8AG0619500 [Eleusine coracana subsp. coracana]
MAEAVVGMLIGKIGAALANKAATYGASLLCKEASALKDLFAEIRKVEMELESMKAYLHDTEKLKDSCESTGIFVKNIRDLAFRIEDVVDEFTYKLEDKHGGFLAKMKQRIKHVKSWHRLALELRSINAQLKEATKRRNRYAITGYVGGSEPNVVSNHQITTFAREEDLVGVEDKVKQLKHWLISDLEERKH